MRMVQARDGFTLIEVLVASLLLSMLVVILTMVFNQSSIAWRTGKASVSQMDQMRRELSQTQRQADNILPGAKEDDRSKWAKVVSPWKDSEWKGSVGNLRRRSIEEFNENTLLEGLSSIRPEQSSYDPWQKPNRDFMDGQQGRLENFIVGVKSLGPDGDKSEEDDISTWPAVEVE